MLTLGSLPQDLGESYALAAFRIVQEAATNALRHARPAQVSIDARADAHTLVLEIRDDGTGLAADWQKPGHFGIRGMRERARMLGGEVRVENMQERGVLVGATLPLN